MKKRHVLLIATLSILSLTAATAQAKRPASVEDIYALKDVGDARVSPDGSAVVFSVTRIDREKNRYITNLFLVAVNGGPPVQLTTGEASDSTPRWSPDGRLIAFASNRGGRPALWVVDVKTREARLLAPWDRSNFFHSKAGEMLTWSPDSRYIAFVASEKPAQAEPADPRVITRLQYKSRTSFSDNLRSHIYAVSLDGGQARQITSGNYDEHSIAWSPRGDEILFLSNRERDPDANFNYDIFAVRVNDGRERRLTSTPGVEFSPAWSPDGSYIAYTATKRPLTTIDSVAEDTHVWVIPVAGGSGTEISGGLDRRASVPQWSADGSRLVFLAGDRGKTLIFSVGREGGNPAPIFDRECQVGSVSISKSGEYVFTMSDETTPAEVFTRQRDGKLLRLTSVNTEMAEGLDLVKPENIRYRSFDGAEIEGWLMRPLAFDPNRKHPMILTIHGGPHGMYGYGFNHTNQVYAARGYAVLYLNPRGSNGYGQRFSDGCVSNWGGGDYQDLMKGVDHALSKYRWIDAARLGVMGGSYGGFMTNWVVTQTTRFKAAIAVASLSNLISFYSTSLYQDLIHVEFNGFPWDNYDLLWKYSPLSHIKKAVTPTLLIHGEQDMDVHITQAEEMYMALRRRGVETAMVRYPREGHGIREPLHRVDYTNRVIAWFDRFIKPGAEGEGNGQD
jgi:dipeptidyl aminopeptidase/acylaminoacyl peptidase